ncbi:ornithine carbamoyltransferase [bacterium BMS3Abin07]|nr:ornithine carbamoyltransferase [bacterium BMS3Abin07]GBE31811.1 ornithine carbamoyltransferase [bacterium BMS3Bbin05]HDL19961.1 ornithine carbamoyltransferase [Nitrospirota bacterium]HDO21885.1 ornithine carbamoyltransferase [Nitrospirota bacterium]HDZ87777.1 ornithine carbamoyltransferase [Nitrospirota bacterium]
MKRDFLRLTDLSSDEIGMLMDRAADMKAGRDASNCPLIGKSIGLIFEKSSTRTRVSFEVGIYQLGAQPIYLNPKEIQLGRGETISDTAKVLSRYLDGIVIRTYGHERLIEFANNASIPVINGLSDLYHPCQTLADLLTIREKKGRIEGIRAAYIGDVNNVTNSLIEASAILGFELVIACPEGYEPSYEILDSVRDKGKGNIIIVGDPAEAAGKADVIYTDVWVSMGQESEAETKKDRLRGYQVNSSLLGCAKKDTIVLHCLPAHRGEEITDDVIDGPNSAVFDQAENRLHTQKALLEFLVR